MVGEIPFSIPNMVQRSLGMYYFHIPVHTTRLILQEADGMEGVLRVLGTVWSKLCVIPLRTTVGRYCPNVDFRSMCASISKQVLPQDNIHLNQSSNGQYTDKQWCFAILKRGSSTTSGPCTLVSPRKGLVLHTREVQDSLKDEMLRMGCIGMDDLLEVTNLSPPTNEDNRSIVTISRVVDTLCIPYVLHENNHTVLQNRDLFSSLPSQTLDVHRLVGFNTNGILEMRDGFRRLWAKSFFNHACYHVEHGQIVRRLC